MDIRMDGRRGIEAWLELAEGSPERERAIAEAVDEMVGLAHMAMNALCRHLPGQEMAIRRVMRHLITHPECLEGGPCVEAHDTSRN